jgi:pimeloyl-ACP methyl ester carboxylesterase
LPESVRAAAVDQRGFGNSDRPESGHAIPEMGADVIGMLDALEIKRATLVAHPFGSFVARQAAIAQPERAGALVLVDPPFGIDLRALAVRLVVVGHVFGGFVEGDQAALA